MIKSEKNNINLIFPYGYAKKAYDKLNEGFSVSYIRKVARGIRKNNEVMKAILEVISEEKQKEISNQKLAEQINQPCTE